MSTRNATVFLCALSMLPLGAMAADMRVPATDIVEAARTALMARASQDGLQLELSVAGRVEDLRLQGAVDCAPELTAVSLPEAWLRPRIGVPVRVKACDRTTSVTVWFALSAPAAGEVYTDDVRSGMPAERIGHRPGQVDLARLQGARLFQAASLEGLRLRRSVHAGEAMATSDFEPLPMVSAQQPVRLVASRGAITLQVPARALADGDAGQVVPVLPSNTTRPINARVLSPGVVTVEH